MWHWVYCTMGQTTDSSMVHKEQLNSKLAWKMLLFIHGTHQSEVGTYLSCIKLKLHVPETVTFLSGVKSIYPAVTSLIRVTFQTYSQQWSHSFLPCGLTSTCPLYAVSYSKPPKLCVFFFHVLYWYCYISMLFVIILKSLWVLSPERGILFSNAFQFDISNVPLLVQVSHDQSCYLKKEHA